MVAVVMLGLGVTLVGAGGLIMLACFLPSFGGSRQRSGEVIAFVIGAACVMIGIGLIYWAGRLAA